MSEQESFNLMIQEENRFRRDIGFLSEHLFSNLVESERWMDRNMMAVRRIFVASMENSSYRCKVFVYSFGIFAFQICSHRTRVRDSGIRNSDFTDE